jgi:uncharacterized protein (TIGR02271 family)
MASRKKTDADTAADRASEAVPEAVGAGAGLAAGAAFGAVAGGPVGAALGAAVGGPIGAVVGKAVDWPEAEPHFKSHWEQGPYKEITTWEQSAPAYRYGFESAGKAEHKGKSYDEARADLRSHWRHKGRFEDMEPMVRTAWEGRAQSALDRGKEAVVPVVEEELQIGKRKVEKGGVKVETKVVETPVEEKVRLHEEHVKVERRPANRPATASDVAFKEGTLELRETAEEAVVAKRARVVEEIVIRKEAADHTQTVRDTVRRTDVDVEKTAGKAKASPVQWETFDADFRNDFKARFGNRGYTYEQYTPAYRFGYNLASDPRYQGDWAAVEPEARRYWEEKNQGTWEDFKDAVRHAWDKVRGRR